MDDREPTFEGVRRILASSAEARASAVQQFAACCVSVDLEVGVQDQRIHRFAAVRGDNGESLVHVSGALAPALARLDAFTDGATILLGHNLLAFDAPHLMVAAPQLRLLRLPRLDTLRLSPLAFPRNPYHRLVKHYQDGQLKRVVKHNDPELDARIALELLCDECRALQSVAVDAPQLASVLHALVSADDPGGGSDIFFAAVRGAAAPEPAALAAAMAQCLAGRACRTQAATLLAGAAQQRWPLAYAAWLSVAGGNSVLPPWVQHQFPDAGRLVRRLRDTPCGDAACDWCAERHDASRELMR